MGVERMRPSAWTIVKSLSSEYSSRFETHGDGPLSITISFNTFCQIGINKEEGYIELFGFKTFRASFYGAVNGTSKSHTHVCSVSLVQTSIDVSVHVFILEIGEESQRAQIERHDGRNDALEQPRCI